MILFDILKQIYWSFKHPTGRFNYLQGILRNIPGQAGLILRSHILHKYFRYCGENLLVHEGVRFLNIHNITVGNDVVMASGSFLQGAGEIDIGDNTLLGPDVKIWSANHRFGDTEKPIIEQGYDLKKVIVGKNVWLGANTIVLPGVHLSEGCVVSACSVVGIKNYPAYSILAGNPCRVIGNRKVIENSSFSKG